MVHELKLKFHWKTLKHYRHKYTGDDKELLCILTLHIFHNFIISLMLIPTISHKIKPDTFTEEKYVKKKFAFAVFIS